jgi:hypothetical protein
LVALLAVVGVVAASGASRPSRTTASIARWSRAQADTTVSTATWREHWIVVGQTCVGTDSVFRTNVEYSVHFACQLNVYGRPLSVSITNWDAMAAAFRTHDIAKIYALLGVPVGSSQAVSNAAAAKWGLKNPRPVAVGITVVSATRWTRTAPPIPANAFNAAVQTRLSLFRAIPAVEAYYADNHTYAGMSLAKLRKIDATVTGTLRIVTTTATRYCVQAGPAPTWFARGPGSPPTYGHC